MKLDQIVQKKSYPETLRAMIVGETKIFEFLPQADSSFRRARHSLRHRGFGEWKQVSDSANRTITITRTA